jgi:proteasome accessory factor C
MSDLSARLRRLLFLVPYVARRHDGVRIDELARELDVDREELLVDLDVLTQVGPPSGDPGEYLLVSVESGKVFVDLAQRLTRPLRLTPAEGCSLLLGLRALRRSGIAPYDRALASAEGKLLKALGADAGAAERLADGTVVAGENPAVAEHLRALLAAARARRLVEIDYSSASSGRADRRRIEPYGIVHHGGAWYTIAGCRRHGDTRTFRVDRIARSETLDETFAPPAAFDLEAYRRERMYVPSADATRVTVRFDALGAARVGSAWPAGEVRRLADGGAEIAIDCEGLEWVVGWVLGFGRHARIVSPEDARAAVRERLTQMRKAAS